MGSPDNPPIPLPRAWAADMAPVGLLALNREGRILYLNAAATRILGGSEAVEIVGRNAREFHAVPEVSLARARDRLEGGELRGMELALERMDGVTVSVLVNAVLLEEAPGGAAAVVSIEDVGRRRAREEGEERGRTMAAVGRLAGGMAHHFNNLLGSILANVSLVAGALGPDAAAREELDRIEAAARRASDIADLLLLVSGKAVEPRSDVNIASWIYGASGSLRERLPEDVELIVRAGSGPLPVRIEEERLLQALQHLVTNAEEALAGGGNVVVEVGELEITGAEKSLSFVPPATPGRYVCIEVGDNGLGMNEETLARVLEPFFSTRRDREGAGLGLATVYGIVARARGHLSIESAPVVGTRVRLIFPFAADLAPEEATTETPLLAEGWEEVVISGSPENAPPLDVAGKERGGGSPVPAARPPLPTAQPDSPGAGAPPLEAGLVMVVDDEDSLREVMAKMLKRMGKEVVTAVNGRDAQRLLHEHGERVELLVTDVMMPEMNGIELVYWARERHPDLPVLLVSGFSESDLVQHWLDREPGSFLAKPFEPVEFIERVQERLDRHAG